jgi:hypothetical protein
MAVSHVLQPSVLVELHQPPLAGGPVVIDEPYRLRLQNAVIHTEHSGGGEEVTLRLHLNARDDLVAGERYRRDLAAARDDAARRQRQRAEALAEALEREKEATAGSEYGDFMRRLPTLGGDDLWVGLLVVADWLTEREAHELAHAYRWAASRRLFPLVGGDNWYWEVSPDWNWDRDRAGRFPLLVREILDDVAMVHPTLGAAFEELRGVLADLRAAWDGAPG